MHVQGTAVVEVALQEPAYRTYMHLAAAMGLRYWVATETPPNNYDHYPHKGITASVETIAAIVLDIRESYRKHPPQSQSKANNDELRRELSLGDQRAADEQGGAYRTAGGLGLPV
jgi:hypothetical protein